MASAEEKLTACEASSRQDSQRLQAELEKSVFRSVQLYSFLIFATAPCFCAYKVFHKCLALDTSQSSGPYEGACIRSCCRTFLTTSTQ